MPGPIAPRPIARAGAHTFGAADAAAAWAKKPSSNTREPPVRELGHAWPRGRRNVLGMATAPLGQSMVLSSAAATISHATFSRTPRRAVHVSRQPFRFLLNHAHRVARPHPRAP